MNAKVSGCFGYGELTTDHAASSYGQPVLVLEDGSVYGPADDIFCSAGEDTWTEPAKAAVARAAVLVPPIAEYASNTLVPLDDPLCPGLMVPESVDTEAYRQTAAACHQLRDRFCR